MTESDPSVWLGRSDGGAKALRRELRDEVHALRGSAQYFLSQHGDGAVVATVDGTSADDRDLTILALQIAQARLAERGSLDGLPPVEADQPAWH